METTAKNIIAKLTAQEIKDAILNYVFKKKPEIRPMGTTSNNHPHIFINVNMAQENTPLFMDMDCVANNNLVVLIILPEEEKHNEES